MTKMPFIGWVIFIVISFTQEKFRADKFIMPYPLVFFILFINHTIHLITKKQQCKFCLSTLFSPLINFRC